ncbi:NAD(P)H-dependent glycerol-3-phosphate dehydrogenase [Kribbella sp. NPDC056345]|uniref:NAD(P)H-dependent glycerol-3-phosphate dehydrogenase n=1 Tax=Kribbella sp. NPDC056345 TaxID=3345789 RepID=UPI0035D96B79
MRTVAVFGAGAWGTTFAMVIARAGGRVVLWSRRESVCDGINKEHENRDYLPGLRLHNAITATTDPATAAEYADVIVLSVPSQVLRDNLKTWTPLIRPGVPIVSLMKGIEAGTAMRMSQVITEVAGVGLDRVLVVTGPNLAQEIAAGQPAVGVLAGTNDQLTTDLCAEWTSLRYRLTVCQDVIGCEIGGATKNVIALAVGMVHGLGLGANTASVLITRGLYEITRLGRALGADPETFAGPAGLGDLVATCISPEGRNRTFGELLGRGLADADLAAASKQLTEGVESCASILELARRHRVDLPVVSGVARVLEGREHPNEVVGRLARSSF